MTKRQYKNEKWYKTSSENNLHFLDIIPYCSGVYAIFIKKIRSKIYQLSYIGSSISIKKRILSYNFENYTYGGGINTKFGQIQDVIIKFKTVKEYGKWLMDEAKLINRLNPELNKYFKLK